MPTALQNITTATEWFVGEDKTLTFTVTDINNAVQDITGWTWDFVVRLRPSNPSKLIECDDAGIGGITHPAPATGVLIVFVARAKYLTLAGGRYWYGLARTNSGSFDIEDSGYIDLIDSAAS